MKLKGIKFTGYSIKDGKPVRRPKKQSVGVRAMHMDVTAERLRDVLSSSPETGKFFWKVRLSPKCDLEKEAGNVSKRKGSLTYRRITIDNVEYRAHRLAWLWVYGVWPPEHVDHIDGDSLNNKISNLRHAINAENGRNRGAQRNNKIGIKGVSWNVGKEKWQAKIQHNGVGKHLGYYVTPEEARDAYREAANELHGYFARFY